MQITGALLESAIARRQLTRYHVFNEEEGGAIVSVIKGGTVTKPNLASLYL